MNMTDAYNKRIEEITGAPSNLSKPEARDWLVEHGEDVTERVDTVESRFSIIPNALYDARSPYHVGHAAAGAWAHIKSLGPLWKFSVQGFASVSDEGITAIQSQMKELQLRGWALNFGKKKNGRWAKGSLWVFLDDPSEASRVIMEKQEKGYVLRSRYEGPRVAENGTEKFRVKDHVVKREGCGNVENPETHPVPHCGKRNSEFSIMEPETPQNPRSQPYMGIPYTENPYTGNPYTENPRLFNTKGDVINKRTNPEPCGESALPGPESESPVEDRSPDGSLSRSAEASLPKSLETEKEGMGELPAPSLENIRTESARDVPEGRFSIETLRGYYPRSSNSPNVKEKEAKAYRKALASGTAPEDVFEAARIFLEEFEANGTDEMYMPGLYSFLKNDHYLKAYLVKVADSKKQSEAAELRSKKRTVNEAIPPLTREEIPFLLDFAATNGSKKLVSLANRLEKTDPYKTLDPEHPEHQLLSRLCRSKDEGLAPQFFDFAYNRLIERSGR